MADPRDVHKLTLIDFDSQHVEDRDHNFSRSAWLTASCLNFLNIRLTATIIMTARDAWESPPE